MRACAYLNALSQKVLYHVEQVRVLKVSLENYKKQMQDNKFKTF